jgi:hypothetical protein
MLGRIPLYFCPAPTCNWKTPVLAGCAAIAKKPTPQALRRALYRARLTSGDELTHLVA